MFSCDLLFFNEGDSLNQTVDGNKVRDKDAQCCSKHMEL